MCMMLQLLLPVGLCHRGRTVAGGWWREWKCVHFSREPGTGGRVRLSAYTRGAYLGCMTQSRQEY